MDISKIKVGSTVYDIKDVTSRNKLAGIEEGAQVHIAPTAAEVKSALGTGSGTSKYLREDGTWVTPPNTNTAQLQVSDATNKKINTKQSTGNYILFTAGTNKFTVSDGTNSFDVGVTPSISNNVTGSSLTANAIVLGNGSSAVKTSSKTIETSLSASSDSTIPTSKAVATYVTSSLTSVLRYKGTIGSSGATVTALPATHAVGDVYVVKVAGTYAGKDVEVGDYIICNTAGTTANDAHWDVVNGENQVENKGVTLAWGTEKTIATVDGTDIKVTLPSNPNTNIITSVAGNTGEVTTAQIATALTNAGYKLTDNNTWTAASTSAAGYVPAATKGKFLHSNSSTGALEWVNDNNTTYSSKDAASGGTEVSLVTTGEKYTWNSKTSNTGTVTKVTAGAGLNTTSADTSTDGGNFTTSGTIYLTKSGVTAGTYRSVTVDKYGRVTAGTNPTDANTLYKFTIGSTVYGTSTGTNLGSITVDETGETLQLV